MTRNHQNNYTKNRVKIKTLSKLYLRIPEGNPIRDKIVQE